MVATVLAGRGDLVADLLIAHLERDIQRLVGMASLRV
jgi:hypothetical protein